MWSWRSTIYVVSGQNKVCECPLSVLKLKQVSRYKIPETLFNVSLYTETLAQ